MSKQCNKCHISFSGFGDTCSTCRKAGPRASNVRQCSVCQAFFSGPGVACESCCAKANEKIGLKAWDEDGLPLEETNVSGIGSDEDKAARKGAASTEPAWQGVGMAPGLWIWRIEHFKVVPWPKKKYGTFYSGDSYIVLHVTHDTNPETGEQNDKLARDIHFWLGKETTTDEKGTAAYKTVELDDFFDGEPIQYREVQGAESQDFKALFPQGISYMAGGIDSGFKVTQVDYWVNKLYQVRRDHKKRIIIEEEQVARSSLNHRDSWILDTGRLIYVWNGESASPFVKNAANLRAENMERERDGESRVTYEIDEKFWAALGGEGPITAADEVGEEVEPDFGEGILLNVQIENRELVIKEVGRGDLRKNMLDTTAVMILDTQIELFVWLGKQANELERRSAMKTATNYLKMQGKPVDKIPITTLKEGKDHKNATWAKIFSD